MNLRSIEYFLITAEEGNVSRAAERLHISQQALSSHIQRLEEEYRVRLFDRKPVFRLSPAGEQMVFFGRQLIGAESSMRASFSDLSQNARATLRVGIPRLRSRIFLPLIWRFFRPAHPNISIDLVDGSGEELSELLSLGKIDLFIAISVPDLPNRTRLLLAEEQSRCFLRASLLEEACPGGKEEAEDLIRRCRKDGADLKELAALPGLSFLALRRGNRLRDALDLSLPRHLRLNYIFESNDQELLYQMAKDGAGIAVFSPAILYQHHRDPDYLSGDLVTFPVNRDIAPTSICLAYRSDVARPGYMNDFIEDTRTVFASYDRSIKIQGR